MASRIGENSGADPVTGAVRDYYRTIGPYYDLELQSRGDEDFWRRLGRTHTGRPVLEVGAGSGRVTALLAEAGASVTAVDLSPDMLRLAADRLGRHPDVSLDLADLRSLALGRTFDLVAAANDPLCHLLTDADRDAALAAVARHLAPGGRFVLDALWFPPDALTAAAAPEGRSNERTVSGEGRSLLIRDTWRCDAETGRCHARYEYHTAHRPAVVAEFEARAWTATELRERFDRAGLRITARWGDFEGGAWDERRSSHFVVEAVSR